MERIQVKARYKCVEEVFGDQYVMTTGMERMLKWCALN